MVTQLGMHGSNILHNRANDADFNEMKTACSVIMILFVLQERSSIIIVTPNDA